MGSSTKPWTVSFFAETEKTAIGQQYAFTIRDPKGESQERGLVTLWYRWYEASKMFIIQWTLQYEGPSSREGITHHSLSLSADSEAEIPDPDKFVRELLLSRTMYVRALRSKAAKGIEVLGPGAEDEPDN